MTKYRVGQRVKLIKNDAVSVNTIGDIGIIIQFNNNGYKPAYRIIVKGKPLIYNISYESDLVACPLSLNNNIKIL